MDNAPKALLMAGGMLMAIIVITIFLIMYNNVIKIEEINKSQNEEEIIKKFNEPFLSYSKNVMYGSDIISVINLAENSNLKYGAKSPTDEFYVDISFKLERSLYSIKDTYIINNDGRYVKSGNQEQTEVIAGGKEYSISKDWNTVIYPKLMKELGKKEQVIVDQKKDGAVLKSYAIVNNVIYELKRKTFACTEVKNDGNGRIISMKFTEKSN